jgi:hypothetical protein
MEFMLIVLTVSTSCHMLKQVSVAIEQGAGRDPESIWTFRRRQKRLDVTGVQTSDRQARMLLLFLRMSPNLYKQSTADVTGLTGWNKGWSNRRLEKNA